MLEFIYVRNYESQAAVIHAWTPAFGKLASVLRLLIFK